MHQEVYDYKRAFGGVITHGVGTLDAVTKGKCTAMIFKSRHTPDQKYSVC